MQLEGESSEDLPMHELLGLGGKKESTGVKWASHYYIYFIMLADFRHLFLF